MCLRLDRVRFVPQRLLRLRNCAVAGFAACPLLLLSFLEVCSAACIDYRRFPHLLAGVDTPGNAQSVAVSGCWAFVADGTAGLQVIAVCPLDSPEVVAGIDTPGEAIAVSISGSLAYLADGTAGLQVIDISVPATPKLIGSIDTPGTASGLVVSGSYVYLADGDHGLQIVDVTDPLLPAIIGMIDTPGFASGVAVFGHYVYVADGRSGLQTIEVVDATSPELIGTLGSTDFVQSLTTSGSHLYFLDKTSGLRILDIQEPAEPRVIGTIDIPDYAQGLVISSPYAYVAHSSGLAIIDIGDPAAPTDAGFIYTPGSARGLALYDSHVIVADDIQGVLIADVLNPISSIIIGHVFIDNAAPVAVSGNYAFLADPNNFYVIDIADPTSPQITGILPVSEAISAIVVLGSIAYTVGESVFRVIDVGDPQSPSIVGSYFFPCCARDLAISGSYAYIARKDAGLQVIDITNSFSLLSIASLDTGDDVLSIGIEDDYAVLGGSRGVTVIGPLDWHYPYSPGVLGSVDTPGAAMRIALHHPYVYVAGREGGLQVIDVSTPSSPTLLGTANTNGPALDVTVSDFYAYVAAGDQGCQVVDIAVPTHPVLLGGVIPPRASALGIAADGSQVYLTQYNFSGFFVLPIQCPLFTSVALSYFQASSRADGVLLEWDLSDAFDVTGFNVVRSQHREVGFERINSEIIPPSTTFQFLDNSAKPGVIYYYQLQPLLRSGEILLLGMATGTSGLDPDVERPQLGYTFPNPSKGSEVSIPFTIMETARVRLRILDMAGRQVRVMLDQVMDPGARSISWDGKDDRGKRAGSGVYQYELETNGFRAARTLIRLR